MKSENLWDNQKVEHENRTGDEAKVQDMVMLMVDVHHAEVGHCGHIPADHVLGMRVRPLVELVPRAEKH